MIDRGVYARIPAGTSLPSAVTEPVGVKDCGTGRMVCLEERS